MRIMLYIACAIGGFILGALVVNHLWCERIHALIGELTEELQKRIANNGQNRGN